MQGTCEASNLYKIRLINDARHLVLLSTSQNTECHLVLMSTLHTHLPIFYINDKRAQNTLWSSIKEQLTITYWLQQTLSHVTLFVKGNGLFSLQPTFAYNIGRRRCSKLLRLWSSDQCGVNHPGISHTSLACSKPNLLSELPSNVNASYSFVPHILRLHYHVKHKQCAARKKT